MGDAVDDAVAPVADTHPVDVPSELRTERLVLRRWQDSDIDAAALINADPDVQRHFASTLTRRQTEAVIAGYEASFDRRGFGPWAIELVSTGELIGFAGLLPVPFEAHFTPAVHLTIKLAPHVWRQHYGLEAVPEVFRDGFERVGLTEIVAYTPRQNEASVKGMAALGMTHDPADDFIYPGLPEDEPMRDQVLCRIRP